MDIMSKFTVKPLLIALALMAIALSVVSIVAWNQASTIDAQEVTIETQTGTINDLNASNKALASANDHQTQKIADLVARYNKLVGIASELEESKRAAVKQRDTAFAKLDNYRRSLNQQRQVIYDTDKTCADWGSRPVCPAISHSLPDEWNKAIGVSNQNGTAGSAEPAAGGDRAEFTGSPAIATTTDTSDSERSGMPELLFEQTAGFYATGLLGSLFPVSNPDTSDQSLIREIKADRRQRQVNLVSLEW